MHDNAYSTVMSPIVTVLIPVYNCQKYLREAIDSILNQTFEDFELLIIDDGSRDASYKIIKSYDDPRIRTIQNKKNHGLVITRNKGVASARGKYIAFLDCDDIAHPERLTEQVSFLEQNPEFGMVGSWIEMIDENSRLTGEVMLYTASPEEIPRILLFSNYFAQSAVLIRKNTLPSVPYRSYSVAEDYDLWVRIAQKTKVWNLQKILVKYRVHQSSATFTHANKMSGYVRDIVRDQLLAIGLDPTKEELDIHAKIAQGDCFKNIVLIGKVESWLLKLYKANLSSRNYQSPYFENFLGHKWFLLCSRASGLGWSVWRVFWRSPLKKIAPVSAFQQINFLFRCALKWQVK